MQSINNRKGKKVKDEYWSVRGNLSYCYKGEKFYTITPLPYYLKRRKILLKKIDEVVSQLKKKKKSLKICDFGSGDGYYCCWLAKKLPESKITGFDISPSMTIEASRRAERENICNISLYCEDFNNRDASYDLVLSLAVLQHFEKVEEIAKKARQIHDHLKEGGMLVLFEATSKKPGSQQALQKRTEAFYENIFRSNGLHLIHKEFLSFPFFGFYQKIFLNNIKKLIPGDSVHKCITINRNRFMNKINNFFLNLCNPLDRLFDAQEGNTVFIFKKNNSSSPALSSSSENIVEKIDNKTRFKDY